MSDEALIRTVCEEAWGVDPDVEGASRGAYLEMAERVTAVVREEMQTRVEAVLHAPEYRWECDCCERVRAVLAGRGGA